MRWGDVERKTTSDGTAFLGPVVRKSRLTLIHDQKLTQVFRSLVKNVLKGNFSLKVKKNLSQNSGTTAVLRYFPHGTVGSIICDLLFLICVTLRNYFNENSRDLCNKQLTSKKELCTG